MFDEVYCTSIKLVLKTVILFKLLVLFMIIRWINESRVVEQEIDPEISCLFQTTIIETEAAMYISLISLTLGFVWGIGDLLRYLLLTSGQ